MTPLPRLTQRAWVQATVQRCKAAEAVGSVMPACGRVPAPEDGAGVTRITRRDSRGMTRKILFGAVTLALLVAGFSVASFPALAELRIITITLEGGQEVVTTVDVPPGTPPEAIQLPELSAPVKKVEDGGPPRSRRPRPTRPRTKKPKDKTKEETRPASSSRRTSPRSRSARSARRRSPATSALPTAHPPAPTRR